MSFTTLLGRLSGSEAASISALVTLAEQGGLDQNEYTSVLKVVTSSNLRERDRLHLTRALIPRYPISRASVLRIISTLGEAAHDRSEEDSCRVSFRLQRRLLNQLAILQYLGAVSEEGVSALRGCYAVLEKGLTYEMLRSSTAMLLVQIVQPRHASSRRLANIQNLLATTHPGDTTLLALEERYSQLLSPLSCVLLHSPSAMQISFLDAREQAEFDRWRHCIERNFTRQHALDNDRVPKRRKLSPCDARTLQRLARKSALLSNRSTLGSNRDLAVWDPAEEHDMDNRARIWRTMLQTMLQHSNEEPGLAEYASVMAVENRSHTPTQCVCGEPGPDAVYTIDAFRCMHAQCEVGGVLPVLSEPVLAAYIASWNGKGHHFFQLLGFVPPLRESDLREAYLDPLWKLAKAADVDWLCEYLRSLTVLATRWAQGYRAIIDTDTATITVSALRGLLWSINGTIERSTIRFPESLELRLAALAFYESSLDLSLVHGAPVIAVPSETFAFTVLCSFEASSISRMAGAIARLREALTGETAAIAVEDIRWTSAINALNKLLIDFGNPLWKRQFLVGGSVDGYAPMELSDRQLELLRDFANRREQSSASALGITTHGAFANLAFEFLRTLARREGKHVDEILGPVSSTTLKELNKSQDPTTFKVSFTEFRPTFLEFLKDSGAEGIYDFLFSSIESLITRKILLSSLSQQGNPELSTQA